MHAPLKVIIVEDNLSTVRSLMQTIDWAELECEIVGTAYDGIEGVRLILDERPDIVLTDIRMPEMDGLKMIEEVRQSMPECKVIVITGYDEFQYASRAIKLSVFDYILKPIDNGEVMRSIRRAGADLMRKAETHRALEQAAELRRRALILSLLLNDSYEGQHVHTMLSDAGLKFSAYYIMIIQPAAGYIISQAAINRLDAAVAECGARAINVPIYDTVVSFIMRGDTLDEWRIQAEKIVDVIRESIVLPARIGISKLNTSHHQIGPTYREARQALWDAALKKNPRGFLFYSGEEQRNMDECAAEMRRKTDLLADSDDFSIKAAEEAAAVIIGHTKMNLASLRKMLALYAMALRKKYPEALREEIRGVSNAADEKDVRTCIQAMFAAIGEACSNRVGCPSLLTRKALQYIRLHAVENVHLDDVAGYLRVSGNYISALVRKETGITFHQHVQTAKMEVARTMLADPRVRVEEVARAVGYENYVSFYNAFKQNENMTPTEYRNR